MTDAAAESTPDPATVCRLSGNVRHLSRMLYMEDTVQQKNHTMNEQLKLINAASDMARVAKKKSLRQSFEDLEKVLELERESAELSWKLKDAESERLKLKYYISEENVSRINKYIEASEVLTNRVRRDLLERDSQLRHMEELLVSAWEQLSTLPQPGQHVSSHLMELLADSKRLSCRCELDGQWDKLRRALKTTEEEMEHLQLLLREQKEEMEVKRNALEEKLLRQTGGDSRGRRPAEKDESVRKKISEIKSQVRKELSEKEEKLRKELSDAHQELTEELSQRHQELRKELSQRDEGLKTRVLQLSRKELSESSKSIRRELRERREGLAQRAEAQEKELLESTKKALSEHQELFQKELSERQKEQQPAVSDSFRTELWGTEDVRDELLERDASHRRAGLMEKLAERDRSHRDKRKTKRAARDKDRSSNPEAEKPPPPSALPELTVRPRHSPETVPRFRR